MNRCFTKSISLLILVFLIFTNFSSKKVLAKEYSGWIQKQSIDRDWKHFPFKAKMTGNYIYSQPNTTEVFRIGFGEEGDQIHALKESLSSEEVWININFEEIQLLKYRGIRSKYIDQDRKDNLEAIAFLCGALLGASLYVNSNNSNVNVALAISEVLIGFAIGGIIGLFGSAICIEKYNSSLLESEK